MKVLIVYGRMYAGCLVKAAQALGKNTWTILLPVGLTVIDTFLSSVLATIPVIGGFLVPLVLAAVGSAYLYFVGEIVGRSRVRVAEFSTAIRAYFWSLINLMFVIWVVSLVLGLALGSSPNANTILLLFDLAVLVLLNPAPEIIYQVGTYGGLATVQRSIEFLQQSWIEWFLPMIAVGAAYYFGWQGAWRFSVLSGMGMVGPLLFSILGGALFHYVMLFRGFLFLELNGSSHRQRMFKYRNALSRD